MGCDPGAAGHVLYGEEDAFLSDTFLGKSGVIGTTDQAYVNTPMWKSSSIDPIISAATGHRAGYQKSESVLFVCLMFRI